jgi:hypothetical protein
MPSPHSHYPTEATAVKGSAPMKATVYVESAAVAASQLQSHFGNTAAVNPTGSTVTITSPQGIKEPSWYGVALTLPTTTAAPQITRMDISVKNTEDGNWDALNYSAPAATALLSRNTQVAAKKAQTEAAGKGASVYSFKLAELAGIDPVTEVFGEDTTSREKKVNAAILDFDHGTNGAMPQYVSGGGC